MAEFQAGDRIVKMSGVNAGKYGTVNSVQDNGTLNVTFDGERLPRFCDPERCGAVAANAVKSRLKGFRIGDKVRDRGGNVGVIEEIQTDDAGPFGSPPSKLGDLLGVRVFGRIGWINEANAVAANSARAANAKFKVGDKVTYWVFDEKVNGTIKSIRGDKAEVVQGNEKTGFTFPIKDLESWNAARNAKFEGWFTTDSRTYWQQAGTFGTVAEAKKAAIEQCKARLKKKTNGLWESGKWEVRLDVDKFGPHPPIPADRKGWVFHNAANAARNATARNEYIDDATARRDIEQSLRKMADVAARVARAKASYKQTYGGDLYAGYVDLAFQDAEAAEDFNPYDVIYALRDNKGVLPKWAWGAGGFNYERRGNTWRIHVGRFAT